MTKYLKVQQFSKAPQQWRMPNSGQMVPGERFLGLPRAQGMGITVPDNYISAMRFMDQQHEPPAESVDAQGEGIDKADKKKKAKENKQKYLRLILAHQKWKQVYESSYQSTHKKMKTYYGHNGRTTENSNFSRGSAIFANRTDSTNHALWSYHRYFNPHSTKKDPVKIDEGEVQYQKPFPSKDVFLHRAPYTQARGSFNLSSTNKSDGQQLHPSGVPDHDFARWYHTSWWRRQGVYKAIEGKHAKAKGFYQETGVSTRRAKKMVKWYTDLQNQDIPRDSIQLTNPKIGFCNTIQRSEHGSKYRSVSSHFNNNKGGCPVFDPTRVSSFEGFNVGWVRPSYPDYGSVAA